MLACAAPSVPCYQLRQLWKSHFKILSNYILLNIISRKQQNSFFMRGLWMSAASQTLSICWSVRKLVVFEGKYIYTDKLKLCLFIDTIPAFLTWHSLLKFIQIIFNCFLSSGQNFLNSYLSVKIIVSHFTFPVCLFLSVILGLLVWKKDTLVNIFLGEKLNPFFLGANWWIKLRFLL